MINYYLMIIKFKYLNNEPIILYYHPNNENFSVIENIFKKIKLLNIKIMTMYEYYCFWINRLNIKPKIEFYNNSLFFNNENDSVEILFDNKKAIINSKAEIQLSNITFETVKPFNIPKDIKKIKKISWRNLLYDFERYNSMRRM